ncbi:hypothetical protein BKP45_06675 [Anaerobacillus alkalidiazotrophicus]|uniref:RNA polymerase sigma-70 region 4 domain-containing protein n=1 Tax=Anaerobacillus alkalidiazotrophicus TaxID=472963 RepID=A0A1S2MC45_9BACI|nr:hypothetical protein [Anaerobacillus alkalidiazotrophicus]OIJ22318.1 hypothetical protein BKP45_06675 [Anaerobacillus alkalidiazotrophicus]
MNGKEMTKEDVLFYLDMIGSRYGPTYQHKFGNQKPYYQLVKEKDSENYKTFIRVYQHYRDLLEEKPKMILDLLYGVESKVHRLNEIGKLLGISGRRVAQIRHKAEYTITKGILRYLASIEPKKPKKPKESFKTVIAIQPDEMLVKMGRAIRSYEAVVEHYFNEKYIDYYKNRKKLERLLIHLWQENELDHRQRALEILNRDDIDIY